MPATVTLSTTPMPMQGVTAPGYGAVDMRRYLGLGFREGVFGAGDYKVIQRAGGAAMAVDVQGGDALVQGDSVTAQGLYHAPQVGNLTSANELTISAAHASLPRIDSIILAIQDTQYDGSGFSRAQVRVLTGTATAGATVENRLGAAAVPSSALLLADVFVGAAVSTIVTANISDRRPLATTDHTAGDVKLTAGTPTTEVGWVLGDGRAISRTVFSELYANHGSAHGAGNGSTTFNVMDARGRAPIGTGTGSGLTARALGAKMGAETVALATANLPAHGHTGGTLSTSSNGSHSHGGNTGLMNSNNAHSHGFGGEIPRQTGGSSNWIGQQANVFDPVWSGTGMWLARVADGSVGAIAATAAVDINHSHPISADGAHTHTVSSGTSANAGSGTAHDNMPPSIALNFLVYHGLAQAP